MASRAEFGQIWLVFGVFDRLKSMPTTPRHARPKKHDNSVSTGQKHAKLRHRMISYQTLKAAPHTRLEKPAR